MSQLPIRLRVTVEDRATLIRAFFRHPMESGFNKGPDGEPLPAHFITEVELRVDGELVATVFTGPGISADPRFSWRVAGVRAGDTIRVSWSDNRGSRQSAEATAG